MYTTQMDAARQGIITEQMKDAALYEGIEVEELASLLARGHAVLPANTHHASLAPRAIPERLTLFSRLP